EGMIIADFTAVPSYEGKTLAEIAHSRGEDPVDVYMDLIAMAQEVPGESVIAKSMTAEDIFTLLSWAHSNVCSDGSSRGHPRGWGAFPRYFSKMDSLPIEERIRKMTSLAAEHVGLAGMGVIEVGAAADLVLMNPETYADRATFDQVKRVASGILSVWVNGVKVYENSQGTANFPGRIIKRMSK
ncbi:MAG: amidohydrolase family protein, partial [Bacteroidota bacterium]